MKNEKGFTLIEVIIGLAILGIVAAGFLGGLATASQSMARVIACRTFTLLRGEVSSSCINSMR